VVPAANPVVVTVIPGTTLVVDATTKVVPELPADAYVVVTVLFDTLTLANTTSLVVLVKLNPIRVALEAVEILTNCFSTVPIPDINEFLKNDAIILSVY
jgi:hypothetical protein